MLVCLIPGVVIEDVPEEVFSGYPNNRIFKISFREIASLALFAALLHAKSAYLRNAQLSP